MISNNQNQLSNKVALVTGGSAGIGAAIVRELTNLGAAVVYTGTSLPKIPEHHPDGSIGIRCDNRNIKEIEQTVNFAAGLGSLDILVNCAGISEKQPIDALTAEAWDRVLETNLRGTVFAIKFAVPHMIQQEAGSIINISSVGGFSTMAAGNTAYVATKGAQLALTRSLVYELAPLGIRVNAVAPGLVQTRVIDRLGDDWLEERSRKIPSGRVGETREIAQVVSFLASDASSYLNGSTIVADGGVTAVTYSDS